MKTKKFLIENKTKIIFYILFILTIAVIIYFSNFSSVFASTEINTQENFDKAYNQLAKLIKQITAFMVGVSVISGFATVIVHLMRLGASGGNPQARAKALQDMMTTVICIALLGSFNLILYLMIALMKI